MGKNWKETIAKEKLSDKDIDEAFKMLMDARKKALASQSNASDSKEEEEKETDTADDTAAQEPSQTDAKEFFTMDEVDKLIQKKVEEKIKKLKPQDADPLQTPSFTNVKPPVAFKVLKMKQE
jgi:hypothetical protein